MKLESLVLDNFKSYRGTQVIGPFSSFSAVIGPNGSGKFNKLTIGKSNLMDAISFVLGLKSNALRSTSLADLVYKDDDDVVNTCVSAVFVKDQEKIVFSRSISKLLSGSEYKINNQLVTFAVYNAQLEKENIIVKAKNFLVFQVFINIILIIGRCGSYCVSKLKGFDKTNRNDFRVN